MGLIRASVMLAILACFVASAHVAAQTTAAAPSATTAAGEATSTELRYLSGTGPHDAVEWDFFVSDGRRGGEWTKIRVPSCWEQEGFGTTQFGMKFYGKPHPPGIAKEQGKYRHAFDVPEAWRGRRVRMVFEGAMTDTHLRVNGISAGAAHQGGFYRFRFDVTEILRYGARNEIEVTVDKESANDSVNLAERRADYWNFGGIFRPVWLEVLPTHFIERTALDARADGTWRAEVFLGDALASAGAPTRVTAQLLDPAQGDAPLGAPVVVAVYGSPDRATLAGQLAAPRLWTAETPHLYRLRLTLERGGQVVHTTTERFGFRTFEVRAGAGLFLNGRRILLKGVNRHSFRPATGRSLSPEDNYADVRLMRAMNLNAVRLSHYPPDPAFLDACDELGLYVLNELGGWHGKYDEATARRLIGQLVSRDVNHPSILFWDNGNEKGWNDLADDEFHRWDPQRRPVLHPQGRFSGLDTMHYRSYGETQEYLRQPEIFLPTEFLHGLYDGGIGAGLHDYWEMLRTHPRAGGGFLWVLADEGLARTDQGGRIDVQGNYGADGIVGPHHEREGSFYTVREVWSPVVVTAPAPRSVLPADFAGALTVENRYDFRALDQVRFRWELLRFAAPGSAAGESARVSVAQGELAGPALAPHTRGELRLPLPADWQRTADVLQVSAHAVAGAADAAEPLWTWSWDCGRTVAAVPGGVAMGGAATLPKSPAADAGAVTSQERDGRLVVTTAGGALELAFDRSTGQLAGVKRAGAALSLGAGPRFVAARRADRSVDGWIDPDAPRGVDRQYRTITDAGPLAALTTERERDGGALLVTARYAGGALREARWRIAGTGAVRLDYTYRYDGVVELMGVAFDYPEAQMRAKRWVGAGPYRVWQNRLHGTVLDLHATDYNDPIPGESWLYPEFKGYFAGWHWVTFTTTEGEFSLVNRTEAGPAARAENYLGVYTPRDGRDALLYTLPETGVALLDVVPAVRNKVNTTDLVGPSSQPQHVRGERRGAVEFQFLAAP